MARGEGAGEGHGAGSGATNETGVVAGSAVAVGLTVFMCVCGLPMFFAGIVLCTTFGAFGSGTLYTVGIVLVVLSLLFLVVGIIFIILLCAGVMGNKNRTAPTHANQTMIVTTGMVQGPPPYQSGPPPGYTQQQPGQQYGKQPGQGPRPPGPPQAQGYPPPPGPPQAQGPPPPGYSAAGGSQPQPMPGAPSNGEMYPPNDPAYPPPAQERY